MYLVVDAVDVWGDAGNDEQTGFLDDVLLFVFNEMLLMYIALFL